MNLSFHIALRYVFAKKSRNVINIISLISAIGITLGSMALIVILSVYNGFDNSIKEFLESYKADYVITPVKGKTIDLNQQWYKELLNMQSIAGVYPIVDEDIFIDYNNTQSIAHAIGVDDTYLTDNGYCNSNLYLGEVPLAVMDENLAHKLGVRIALNAPLEIYFPDKDAQISLSNPTASLNYKKLFVQEIFKANGIVKQDVIYAPIDVIQELTGYKEYECSKIELYTDSLFNNSIHNQKLREIVPNYLSIKDKLQQDETLNKVIQSEKIVVYLILFFVIIIISINIFSSLAMLIIDKKEDIETFQWIGAKENTLKQIFYMHGMFVCLMGTIAGIAIGIIVTLLQEHFHIVAMPGNYIIEYYPVKLQLTDIAITFFGVITIGLLASYLPVLKFFKK